MKRFNLDQFIWFVILFTMGISLTVLVLTGDIYMIVDSNRKISTWFMLIVIYILAFIQCTRIKTVPSRQGIKGGYIQFLFLILVLGFVSTINITKVSLEAKGVKLYHASHNHNDIEHHGHSHTEIEVLDNIVKIPYQNFHSSVEELFSHKAKYIGKPLEIEGIYYAINETDDFIITMLEMNCCIADSEYVGIYCDGLNALDNYTFESGDKIKVRGVIENFEDDNKELIKIKVNSVHPFN
ncbi:MAG: TIGR03943 family putative permease subunit [Sarcina sp.]